MPQEFQVLRCCDCEKFQVYHVIKAKKWQCKVCGQKQTLKRAFFIGSSRECRLNVQEMNFQAGEQETKRRLAESCNFTDEENPSSESVDKDLNFSTENDWVDGIDENDWVDENDWIDEDDGIDDNPSEIFNRLESGNLPNDFEDELPRKKQRCESYAESETVEDNDFIQLTEDVHDQKNLSFSSALKHMQDYNSSKSSQSANNISNSDIPEVRDEQECGSVKEENSLADGAKSKSNSILKPTRGFQLILNEAKKQRTDLSFDLDW